ncbi:MAG: DUF4367 domain-containing protein [Eubacteriales bacterium]
MKKKSEDMIDEILEGASRISMDSIINNYPSVEELKEKYDFSKKHNKRMEKLFRKSKKVEGNYNYDAWQKFRKFSFNAAAVICMIFTLFTLLAFTVPPIRVTIANYIVEYNEKYVELNTNHDNNIDDIYGAPQYIPEGYMVKDIVETKSLLKIIYINDDGKEIYFDRYNGEVNITVDNENSEFKKITIKEFTGYTITKNGQSTIVFYTDTYTYSLIADLEYSEIILIAESISIK